MWVGDHCSDFKPSVNRECWKVMLEPKNCRINMEERLPSLRSINSRKTRALTCNHTYIPPYRPVHNTTLNNALRCVVFASTLVETQHDARIDLDPILAFPCVAFLRLVVEKSLTF